MGSDMTEPLSLSLPCFFFLYLKSLRFLDQAAVWLTGIVFFSLFYSSQLSQLLSSAEHKAIPPRESVCPGQPLTWCSVSLLLLRSGSAPSFCIHSCSVTSPSHNLSSRPSLTSDTVMLCLLASTLCI